MAIQSNESNFKEEDTIGLFDYRNPNECDLGIVDLMEKNTTLKEELIYLKRNVRDKQSNFVKRPS